MQHSALVNSHARQDMGGDFTTDDWYAEVKANGVAKLKEVLSAEQWQEVEALQARIDKQVRGEVAA